MEFPHFIIIIPYKKIRAVMSKLFFLTIIGPHQQVLVVKPSEPMLLLFQAVKGLKDVGCMSIFVDLMYKKKQFLTKKITYTACFSSIKFSSEL